MIDVHIWARLPTLEELEEKVLELATDPAHSLTPKQIWALLTRSLCYCLDLKMSVDLAEKAVKKHFPTFKRIS